MVQLYLIRHAIAEERGAAWPDDTLRPLTEAGRSRMRKAASGLVRLGVQFDIVLSSPLVRARQTAELVVEAFDDQPPLVVFERLAPDTDHAELFEGLRPYARHRGIALVGHEPDLGALAAHLIGARQSLEFRKGAVCRIDLGGLPPTSAGVIRWFVTPATLRAVGA